MHINKYCVTDLFFSLKKIDANSGGGLICWRKKVAGVITAKISYDCIKKNSLLNRCSPSIHGGKITEPLIRTWLSTKINCFCFGPRKCAVVVFCCQMLFSFSPATNTHGSRPCSIACSTNFKTGRVASVPADRVLRGRCPTKFTTIITVEV